MESMRKKIQCRLRKFNPLWILVLSVIIFGIALYVDRKEYCLAISMTVISPFFVSAMVISLISFLDRSKHRPACSMVAAITLAVGIVMFCMGMPKYSVAEAAAYIEETSENTKVQPEEAETENLSVPVNLFVDRMYVLTCTDTVTGEIYSVRFNPVTGEYTRTSGSAGTGSAEPETSPEPETAAPETLQAPEETETEPETEAEPETLDFTDVFGNWHTLDTDPDAPKNDYIKTCFVLDGQLMSYTDTENYIYRLGIDVSYHQGNIDWESVAEQGYEFVFIRIGFRGYGQAGNVLEDEQFKANLEGAKAAGLDVGVYFFSQALTEEEAAYEAEFVLELLAGTELDLPVVYDPEYILDDEGNKISEARTSTLSGEQVTENTLTFCSAIEEAGYEAAFYTNMLSESEVFDMTALSAYTVWYADYNETPQTPYAFEFWQYSESGTVAGIDSAVDLDIQLIPAG